MWTSPPTGAFLLLLAEAQGFHLISRLRRQLPLKGKPTKSLPLMREVAKIFNF